MHADCIRKAIRLHRGGESCLHADFRHSVYEGRESSSLGPSFVVCQREACEARKRYRWRIYPLGVASKAADVRSNIVPLASFKRTQLTGFAAQIAHTSKAHPRPESSL